MPLPNSAVPTTSAIAAVLPQHRAAFGDVPEGRRGVDHPERNTLPDQPIGGSRRRQSAAALECIIHQRQALIETVAAIFDVVAFLRAGRDHRVAGMHDIALTELDRVHAEPPRQLVHRRFNREIGLRQAVAAEGAARHGVGVDRIAVDLFVVAAIDGEAFAAGVIENGEAVIAVGAGVGDDVHLHGGQVAVAPRSDLDAYPHRVPRRRADELFLAGEFELDRLAGFEHGERDDILDQHFLLGAEAAADALAEHADLCRIEIEQRGQRPPREERRLGARPHIEPLRLVEPADRAVRFQMRVLDAVRQISAFVHDIGLGKSLLDVADIAVDLAGDVALRIVDARFRSLVVNDRRARLHRRLRIEHGGKDFVVHDQPVAARFGGGLALGHHRGDALADETHDPVQHRGVVGIDAWVLMAGASNKALPARPRRSGRRARPAPRARRPCRSI